MNRNSKVSEAGGRVLVLDNRDSFVFNLVDEFRVKGCSVTTIRSNTTLNTLEKLIAQFSPHMVILSPGPGKPENAGVMVEWLQTVPDVPVLGVCLGHQALAVAAGGKIGPAPSPVHGQKSNIQINATDVLFNGIGDSFVAARYHSLVVTEAPSSMRVIATASEADENLIMALRHRKLCQLGLQFHPESILTPMGRTFLWRFFNEAYNFKVGNHK